MERDDMTIHDRLAALGYSHESAGWGYKHNITDASGTVVGCMTAHEAAEFVESIGG